MVLPENKGFKGVEKRDQEFRYINVSKLSNILEFKFKLKGHIK